MRDHLLDEPSPDIRATMRSTNGAGPLGINPGNCPLVGLLFDVPKGTQPSQYLLRRIHPE
jgi:hypothetical protein